MAGNLRNRQQELYEERELLKFLPSDIFPVDQQQQPHVSSSLSFSNSNQPNHSNYNNYNYYSYSNVDRHFSCMDAHNRLSQGLAASFSFIRLTTPPPPPQSFFVMPPPNLELHRLAHQRVSSVTLPDLCTCGGCILGANQIRVCGAGAGVGVDWNSYGPVHSFHEMNSVQPQAAECFMEGRAMGLQGMQYHGWANRLMEKPILPFHGGGGFNGGTGVYLPRVPASISSTTTANHIDVYRRRRQGEKEKSSDASVSLAGARKRRDDEAQFLSGTGMNSVNNTDHHKKKQEDCLSQVSPEMGLPEDWTY